ncbi:hypothetical protein TTRE_0000898701 [Trichuris trichiura]|uniref:DNA polymerase delta subunit OB-fold domain-containing protein n=1 Tax=Trichuris trichiura TaxID=36087 RepID=A0A077ZLH3_TRITR|nr:hypothetical protein TTRE_0000898701 [Trichuris trichiura]
METESCQLRRSLKDEYNLLNQQFVLAKNSNFQRQYFGIYRYRLHTGSDVKVKVLSDLVEFERCVIVGTVYKLQEMKPSVVKELRDEIKTKPQPMQPLPKYADSKDEIVLEDEELRVKLVGCIETRELCTGKLPLRNNILSTCLSIHAILHRLC